MQALDGREWRTFKTLPVRSGRFAYRYRFRHTTGGARFLWRVYVRAQAGPALRRRRLPRRLGRGPLMRRTAQAGRSRRAFGDRSVGGAVAAARAAELTITAQAVAAHGEFLTQAPAPPTPGVLCLVDSGVDVNPDTQAILVARESVFGGTLDDVTAYHHGTYVAMVAGAAANSWGMIGAWPQLKVLSVRALAEGSEHLAVTHTAMALPVALRRSSARASTYA